MFLPDDVVEHVRAVTDEPDLGATKYRLLRPLGRGGMGSVYAVEDLELGRDVALKVSSGAGTASQLCARVRREAQVIARLEHPGIVPVHDVGELPDGRVFYVMKLVKGERLDEWLERGVDLRSALVLFQRICEAVAFAHAHGVIHRDLKPENVMVGAFGEAVVMDWGLARAGPDPDLQEGAVVGTSAYMSPEQTRGEIRMLGPRSDVWSLGAILRVILAKHPDIIRPLHSICRKAMAPTPGDRYPTALALAEDVRLFLDGLPVGAHPETLLERGQRFVSRHQVVVSLLLFYLVVRLVIALA